MSAKPAFADWAWQFPFRANPFTDFYGTTGPGAHPGAPVFTAPDSARRLSQLPGFKPYAYNGTGRDTLTPHIGMSMTRACLAEKCWTCQDDAYCPCACHDGDQP